MVDAAKEVKAEASYFIDMNRMEAEGHSMGAMLASRRCKSCKKILLQNASPIADSKVHLKRIAECCSQESDYISANMPLLEAVFRIFLASGNRPMSLKEIHNSLSERWTVSGFPKYLPIVMLERMLDRDDFYGISRLSDDQKES
ncbi:MAG: hypothetical protein HY666_01695 [Chloroflexi bacterium]|nr:hypothetical protein [Chloroflexota bacterium]